jgi:hypothetical protein
MNETTTTTTTINVPTLIGDLGVTIPCTVDPENPNDPDAVLISAPVSFVIDSIAAPGALTLPAWCVDLHSRSVERGISISELVAEMLSEDYYSNLR